MHLLLELRLHAFAQQCVFEEKHIAHEVESVFLVDDLHSDILMQWLFHDLICILFDKVDRFPHLFLIGADDHHIIAVYLHPHVEEHHYQSAQRTCVVVGDRLYWEQSDAQSAFTCRHYLADEIADALIAELLSQVVIHLILVDVMVELHEVQFDEIDAVVMLAVDVDIPFGTTSREVHPLTFDRCRRVVVIRPHHGRHDDLHQCMVLDMVRKIWQFMKHTVLPAWAVSDTLMSWGSMVCFIFQQIVQEVEIAY